MTPPPPEPLDDLAGVKSGGDPSLVWIGCIKLGAAEEFSMLEAGDLGAVTFEARDGESDVLLHLRAVRSDSALAATFSSPSTPATLSLLEAARDIPETQRVLAVFTSAEPWGEVTETLREQETNRLFHVLHQLASEHAAYYGPFSVAS